MDERERLTQAIAALEAQRPLLGDAVVDPAINSMREKLATLTPSASLETQRKQVTILFADVSGFTALSETLDIEDVTEIMNAIWQQLDGAILAHGGYIDKHIGDAVMAVWGVEQVREDDPEQAVRAALAMQAALSQFNQENRRIQIIRRQRDLPPDQPDLLRIRIGINTGPVRLGQVGTTGEYTAMGDSVNLASRLEHAAPVGGILIAQETYHHVRGLFLMQAQDPFMVKGKSDPILSYTVLRARPQAFRMGQRGVEGVETELIGRHHELNKLQNALQAALSPASHPAHILTVVGDAGVGKSRLLHEFEQWIYRIPDNVTIIQARARPERQTLPWALLRDIFTRWFDIQETDSATLARQKLVDGITLTLDHDDGEMNAHFIGQLLGFDFRHSPHLHGIGTQIDAQELRDRALLYCRQFFQQLSQQHPLLILLEDIHWADDSSLAIWPSWITGWQAGSALIVAVARPALFEKRPNWAQAPDQHQTITLAPLTEDDCEALVAEILQHVDDIPGLLRDLIVKKADGNPFYVEEMIKMLIEDGIIIKDTPHWWVDISRLDPERIPSTLTGVLQALLDRLEPAERTLLQQASVIGRTFWDGALLHMSQAEATPLTTTAVDDLLQKLRDKEMIFRRRSSAFAYTQELIFKHAILRDVTYESVLKRQRRLYHRLVADWLIDNTGGRQSEFAGLIAEHLYRGEDFSRAVRFLQAAGAQAADQYANQEAIDYFSRALGIVDPDDAQTQYDLLLAREQVFDLQGERVWQAQDLERLIEIVAELPLDQQAVIALREANYSGIMHNYEETITAAQWALELGTALEQPYAQAKGHFHWGWALRRLQQTEQAEEHINHALQLARDADLPQVEADCLRSLAHIFDKKDKDDRALQLYEEALAIYRRLGDRRGEGRALNGLGNLASERREYATARRYYEQNLAISQAIGDRSGEAWAWWWLGQICLQQKQFEEALQHYRQTLSLRQEIGDELGVAMAWNHMGRAALYNQDFELARQYCRQANKFYDQLNELEGRFWAQWWGGNAIQAQADYATAAYQYEQLLKLEPDEQHWHYRMVRGRLCQVYSWQGAYEAAQREGEQALADSRLANDKWGVAHLLIILGYVVYYQDDLAAAEAYWQEALTLRRELGLQNGPIEPEAGLALVAWGRGDKQEAGRRAAAVATYLDNPDEHWTNIQEPARLYWVCSHVLSTDPRAADWLATGQQMLIQYARRHVPESAWREAFWQLPWRAALRPDTERVN
ncbi:MAG TPA: adenylate/guanylate cyclase domain-containing protein [Anaerolineae bacterium]|nr:adenylate/guanylate cyclase domain-containing protein [Anaerolineae bacterium]